MPLSQIQPFKPTLFRKVKDSIVKFINFIRLDTILGIFLAASILFEAFGRKVNWGFYVIFGIFALGYLAERILRILKKKRPVENEEEI